eukprot:scaffold3511_cov144-Skeletonema_dohrnii-CCMP3373.AAC.2
MASDVTSKSINFVGVLTKESISSVLGCREEPDGVSFSAIYSDQSSSQERTQRIQTADGNDGRCAKSHHNSNTTTTITAANCVAFHWHSR